MQFVFFYLNFFHSKKFKIENKKKSIDTSTITTPFMKIQMKYDKQEERKKRFECVAIEITFKWDTWVPYDKTDCRFYAVRLEPPFCTLPN